MWDRLTRLFRSKYILHKNYDGFLGEVTRTYRLSARVILITIVLPAVSFLAIYYLMFSRLVRMDIALVHIVGQCLPVLITLILFWKNWTRDVVIFTQDGMLIPDTRFKKTVPLLWRDAVPYRVEKGFLSKGLIILSSVDIENPGIVPFDLDNAGEAFRYLDERLSAYGNPIPTEVRKELPI